MQIITSQLVLVLPFRFIRFSCRIKIHSNILVVAGVDFIPIRGAITSYESIRVSWSLAMMMMMINLCLFYYNFMALLNGRFDQFSLHEIFHFQVLRRLRFMAFVCDWIWRGSRVWRSCVCVRGVFVANWRPTEIMCIKSLHFISRWSHTTFRFSLFFLCFTPFLHFVWLRSVRFPSVALSSPFLHKQMNE